jgi:hypothetical protein
MKILALVAALLVGFVQPGGLKIVVIEGEGAVNIIQQKTAVSPLVEVRDRNNNPVAGAVVTFTIQGGNSAAIAGGAQTISITTNTAGRAAMAALNPVNPGTFQIQVQAAFQGQTAAAAITQTNVMTAAQAASATAAGAGGAGAGGGGGGISGLAIGGIVGGAAVAGGVLAVTSGVLGGSGEVSAEALGAAGTYTLQQINGGPLPALTILSPPNPCTGFTDSATINLATDPKLMWELTEHSRIECNQGPANRFDGVHRGNWSIQGSTITFTGNLNLGPGALNGSTLTFEFDAPHANAGNPDFRVTSTWRK